MEWWLEEKTSLLLSNNQWFMTVLVSMLSTYRYCLFFYLFDLFSTTTQDFLAQDHMSAAVIDSFSWCMLEIVVAFSNYSDAAGSHLQASGRLSSFIVFACFFSAFTFSLWLFSLSVTPTQRHEHEPAFLSDHIFRHQTVSDNVTVLF